MQRGLESGTVIAGYRVESLLGEGATGAVYLARAADGVAVALKLLAPELARDERFRARFLRETQAVAGLDHPRIVTVLSSGEEDGFLHIAMPYVDGLDLRELLRREGPLEPKRTVELIGQIAEALDAAHAAGLVHRDVKPANVLVAGSSERPSAVLCDFGLARHTAGPESLTGDRALLGTIAYIAPEQIEGGAVDRRADVYALGCVLYECLVGSPPFERETELAVLYAHLNEPAPRASVRRPELPVALDDVLATALDKDPAKRPASAGELASAAAAALRGERVGRRRRASRAGPLVVGVAVAVAAAAMALERGEQGDPSPPSAELRTGANRLSLIDPAERRVQARIELGGEPGDVALAADHAWVTVFGEPDRLVRVDPERRRVTASVRLPFRPTAVIGAGRTLWVVEEGGPRVARVDGNTGRLTRTFQVADYAHQTGPAAFADGSLWLGRGPQVLRVHPRTGRVLHRFDTPVRASLLEAGRGAVWAVSSEDGRVARIDPVENRVTARTRLHAWASDLALGGGFAWVSVVPDDVVFKLSADDAGLAGALPAGPDPERLLWGAGGLWIASDSGRALSQIDPEGGTTRRLVFDARPAAAWLDGGLLWAATAPAPALLAPVEDEQEVRIPLATDVINVDPAVALGPVNVQLAYATCARLLSYPDRAGEAGRRLMPEVAAELPSVTPDGRTWTFRVRPGFRFAPPSGAPVTAQTFRATIERSLSPRLGEGAPALGVASDIAGVAAYRAGRAAHIRGLAVSGDRLSITLKRPAGDLPARMAMPFFCAVPPSTPTAPGGLREPIPSAGPYYVASHGAGQTVLLRNPNYRGSRPRRPRRIVYTIGASAEKAIALVDGGAAEYVPYDFDPHGPLARGGRLDRAFGAESTAAERGDQRYFASAASALDLVAFNARRPPFRDARLRRAAAAALDRRALAAVWNEIPTDRYVPDPILPRSARPGFDRPDLRAARRLARGRTGTAVLYFCGEPANARIGEIIRSNLGAIGIRVRLAPSLDCLRGPDPKRERADLSLVTTGSFELDPFPFLAAATGDDRRFGDPVPDGWGFADMRRHLTLADRLRGTAREKALAALEQRLLRHEVPMAAYGEFVAPEYLSPKLECRIFQGAYRFLDLGAACIRKR
jgi:ABC-type transport system substrate-binding protein/predicted Ser/Thr protein kinase